MEEFELLVIYNKTLILKNFNIQPHPYPSPLKGEGN